MVRKTRAKKTSTSSTPEFQCDKFRTLKNHEAYKKLNVFRPVWAECRIILDEVGPEIQRNFKRRGWLPLLEVEHPPSVALTRKFYSNLSVHSDNSNIQFVKSWIRDEEYVITPRVVHLLFVYPYTETPHLDDIMSLITDTSISWGTDPRVTSHELTKLNYLFLGFLVVLFGLYLIFILSLLRVYKNAHLSIRII